MFGYVIANKEKLSGRLLHYRACYCGCAGRLRTLQPGGPPDPDL